MQPRRTSSGTFMYNFHDLRTAEAMHPYLYIYMPIVALISYLQFGVYNSEVHATSDNECIIRLVQCKRKYHEINLLAGLCCFLMAILSILIWTKPIATFNGSVLYCYIYAD